MTNPALGTKRNCPNCNSHFYDLNKTPATCPKCKHQFDPALQAKAKKRVAKRTNADDEESQKDINARKAELLKKKARDEADEGAHDIEEMDELDGIDEVDELSELEVAEDEQLNEDDADDETIIEDLDAGDESLVDNIEEEEAQALVDEIEDERAEAKKSSRNKKS